MNKIEIITTHKGEYWLKHLRIRDENEIFLERIDVIHEDDAGDPIDNRTIETDLFEAMAHDYINSGQYHYLLENISILSPLSYDEEKTEKEWNIKRITRYDMKGVTSYA